MLAKLKDIHEPLPPSAWPLALGWWLLLALVLAAIAGAIWYWRRQRITVGDRLQQRLQQLGNGEDFLAMLNQLLKEAACYYHPKDQVSILSGKPWLAFLQAQATQPVDRHLIELLEAGPYAKSFPIRYELFRDLKAFASAWIHTQEGHSAGV
ncbi:DUF4381 domain-containing protein [Gallaecimonas xiamenensis]|uniref:DUF4381 domain-containing protein n=1 Tax=Gallaecimonas xiamenensis 3-C-1 TaxID=745411 RepID=K2K0G7_9GAMM|nr:DUF4381 domain-containing protein [Gallaecimonas xiamenensis]EKE76219.1 hypothetical protein B3C1_04905 [Gallaecimonas xiamenensis 3-C-1]